MMVTFSPQLIRERKFRGRSYHHCMIGTEMVDWLAGHDRDSVREPVTTSRLKLVGIWQALLEMSIISHVNCEYPFMDKYLFYRWTMDEQADEAGNQSDRNRERLVQLELPSVLVYLHTVSPDALFRMILRKPSGERTAEELELVYEELLHIKALAHLSTMVKRELANAVVFEQHSQVGTVLFHQGDEGKSWYIILSGAVDVSIHGKGVVCTLHEGDDFGKLALVNDTPRAATIVLRYSDSQFLRVDKHDFNRILRDVEANTVRLKEHGQEVLVLEKIVIRIDDRDTGHRSGLSSQHHRYSVMAGMPGKMLEYLLETRMDAHNDVQMADTFVDDFILTHLMFMPTNVLSDNLKAYFQKGCSVRENANSVIDGPISEHLLVCKKRVVAFLSAWIGAIGISFFSDPVANSFIEELYCAILEEFAANDQNCSILVLRKQMNELMSLRERAMQMLSRSPTVVLDCGVYRVDAPAPDSILPFDTCIYRIHTTDGTYFTLNTRLDKTAEQICTVAATKFAMGTGQGVDLVEVKSGGEKVIFAPSEIAIPTLLSLNGRLFLSFKDQIDTLTPLFDQKNPRESVHSATLELLSSTELAYQLAVIHEQLLTATHENELISQIIGRDNIPGRVPSNLDILVRRFNEIQFWTTSEILLASGISKRLSLLKKFIKIAAQAKLNQDIMSFFAIIFGLSNVAVSRLNSTWDKLGSKFRRLYLEFEGFLDPSRNHRAYRMLISKMSPPSIPFIPLILKDLAFVHYGNKTYFDGLVNFEKMHMIAEILRNFRRCKSRPFVLNLSKHPGEAKQLVRNFKVIDDQRRLMKISYQIEPPRHKDVY